MPTRLGQNRVKSSDPAYSSLKDQLSAKMSAEGEGYIMPVGGIPRSDMTSDVQIALQLAESAYQKSQSGIPLSDLESSIQDDINHGKQAYIKPIGGIPLTDLTQALQDSINSISNFYQYPTGGIPRVDLDEAVRTSLSLADSAYQKPTDGIPLADLKQEVLDAIHANDGAYQKPEGGIPLTDLAESVAKPSDLIPMTNHINDSSLHITDHDSLQNIGRYRHNEIDTKLDQYQSHINKINRELEEARDEFASIGARIDATLGRNSVMKIEKKNEWEQGTFTDLHVTNEGNVSFLFEPENVQLRLYDISTASNYEIPIGGIDIGDYFIIDQGEHWINNEGSGDNYDDYVGVEFKGYLYAPVSGEYKFKFVSPGRTRLLLAGQLLVNDATYYSGGLRTREFSIHLDGGRAYPVSFTMDYHRVGERKLQWYWKTPAQTTMQLIPTTMLNHSGYAKTTGTYESHVIDLLDDQISQWFLECNLTEYRVSDDITAYIKTSDDGITFTDWVETEAIGEIQAIPKRFIQLKLVLNKDFASYTPVLHDIQIRYVSAASQQEYIQEMIEARDQFLHLKDRFENIDQQLELLSQFPVNDLENRINYFTSSRMKRLELNILNWTIEKSLTEGYQLIEDGFVDHFTTLDFIDEMKSVDISASGHEIRPAHHTLQLTDDADWAKFTHQDINYGAGNMRLAPLHEGQGFQTELDNRINSATVGNAYLGDYYSDYIAQPFYTQEGTVEINYFYLYLYYSYSRVYYYIGLVESDENGKPDWRNPLYETYVGTGSAWSSQYYGGSEIGASGLKIPVKPNTKYWIVLREVGYSGGTSSRLHWYVQHITSSSSRIQSDNPENKNLLFQYSHDGNNWYEQPNYALSFKVGELSRFKDSGQAEYIYDTINGVDRYLSAVANYDDNGGILSIRYQESEDLVNWSNETADITELTGKRHLKILVEMHQSDDWQTPYLYDLTITYAVGNAEIISKPISVEQLPNKLLFVAKDNDDIPYYVSRDDGITWTRIYKNQYQSFDGTNPGNQIRLKAVFDGLSEDSKIDYWGLIAITQDELSPQHITALNEDHDIESNGEKTITLNSTYPIGKDALQVYLNGILQSEGKDYIEVDAYTIEFLEGLQEGDRVTCRVAVGAYDIHDHVLVGRLIEIEKRLENEYISHDVTYEYDENDRLVKETYNGTQYKVVDHEYDEFGRKSKKTITYNDRITTIIYTYDAQSRLVRKEVTHSEVINP